MKHPLILIELASSLLKDPLGISQESFNLLREIFEAEEVFGLLLDRAIEENGRRKILGE